MNISVLKKNPTKEKKAQLILNQIEFLRAKVEKVKLQVICLFFEMINAFSLEATSTQTSK